MAVWRERKAGEREGERGGSCVGRERERGRELHSEGERGRELGRERGL